MERSTAMDATTYPLGCAGLLAGAHAYAIDLLGSKVTGAVIALMAAAGAAAALVTFFF
jgi:hypothetical protein